VSTCRGFTAFLLRIRAQSIKSVRRKPVAVIRTVLAVIADWLEGLVKAYVGHGIAADFYLMVVELLRLPD
jgi:hypothetical protein